MVDANAHRETPAESDKEIAFGNFRLIPARQQLLEGDKPVRLGSRALDILIALVERSGDLVTKGDLLARVWPGIFVEEANLRVHISALRKALGDGLDGKQYLANVPGRGYRFMAPVVVTESRLAPLATPAGAAGILPVLLVRVVGRDDLFKHLAAGMERERLVTIVGPGGIGKTTVALSVAHAMSTRYRNGICFVDLAPLADPALVPSVVAAALGFADPAGDVVRTLAAGLRDREQLIILDSCEHVIQAIATIAEEILRAAPHVRILATSREPLRAEGERIHRITSLSIPIKTDGLTASAALGYSAIRLFVERATASRDDFELSDGDAPVVAEICKKLDGLALAIELAAGRIDTLGVREIAALLDNRLRSLTSVRRTAMPRHQTLLATFDWSHDLLSDDERTMLRRLGIFAGWFDADAVLSATSDEGKTAKLSDLANLVAKSLVAADVSGANAYYRLLDTTRAYALDKLSAASEADATARRHAVHYRDLLERVEADSASKPTPEVPVEYGGQLDNVRVALDWAFGTHGDPGLARALTAAAVPLWRHLSLMQECRNRVNQALSTRAETEEATRHDMQLFAALGATLLSTTSSPSPLIVSGWTKALTLAEQLGDVDYQLRALWGLWLGGYHGSKPHPALALAERFRSLADSSGRPLDALIGERIKGVSLLLMGRVPEARPFLERVVTSYDRRAGNSDIRRFHFDQSVVARSQLAQILWLQGFADQATRDAQIAVEDAISIDHGLSVCGTLEQAACPIALLTGDLAAAEHYITMLLERAERDELTVWLAWGRCFRAILQTLRGDALGGVPALRAGLAMLGPVRSMQRQLGLVCALAACERRAGDVHAGLASVEMGLRVSEQTEEVWVLPELLRVKGDLLIALGGSDQRAQAKQYWVRSMEVARQQGALSWELRAALSFAMTCKAEGHGARGRDVLAPVFSKFTEGFGTRDLIRARALLDRL